MSRSVSVRAVVSILLLGILVVGSNAFVLSPILTDVAAALGTTPVVVGRVISANGAATAISAFFLAGLVDRLGARTVLLTGATAMAVALGLSAVASSWPMLAGAQALAGLSAGVMVPAVYTMAAAVAPEGAQARTLSRVLNGWAISLVAGVPVSAFLADVAGWRAAFGALAGLATLTALCFLALPRREGAGTGAVRPATPARALAIPGVPRLVLICLAFMTAFYGTYAFLGDHLRGALHLDAGPAGLVVLAYGAGFGFASLGGRGIDRLGPARVLPLVLLGVVVIYLAMIPLSQHFASAIAIAAIWGFVNQFGLTSIVLLLAARRPSARGALMGLHSTATYVAVFAGPLGLGALYARFSFTGVVVAAAIIVACGAALAATLPRAARAEAVREGAGAG